MLQWVMILSRVRARKGEMLWMCQGPRVLLCTVWHTFSLPGEVKIFSIPLNNFTSWRSRVQSIGQSVVLYSATSALRCPTGRFQHVTHICGPTMKESKQPWEGQALGSMKIADAFALGSQQHTASSWGTWQAHGHEPNCGTVHGISLSTLDVTPWVFARRRQLRRLCI